MYAELNGVASGGKEPIYAQALVLNEEGGRPTLSPEFLVNAARSYKRGDGESDVILVASDASLALILSLPVGITLVGIVAEEIYAGADTPIPIISGVFDARLRIEDTNLLILDPQHGVVMVEPDAQEFARLQAERQRPRLRLGAANIPARTQSGRQVDVWASVQNEADLDHAFNSGADGIFLPQGSIYLGREADIDEAFASLVGLADRLGGGNIAVKIGPDEFDAETLFMLSSRCNLTWILRADDVFPTLKSFRNDLEERRLQFIEERSEKGGVSASIPALSVWLDSEESEIVELTEFDELFIGGENAQDWVLADTFGKPPIRIVVSDDSTELQQAITLCAAGVIVLPNRIKATKDFIREQEY